MHPGGAGKPFRCCAVVSPLAGATTKARKTNLRGTRPPDVTFALETVEANLMGLVAGITSLLAPKLLNAC